MIYLNDHLNTLDLETTLPLLSAQRREQALKYKHDQGRRTCVAAYLLLCEGLKREYGITKPPVFGYGEHGKPYIIGEEHIYFNMSHCREAAICAIAPYPIGIDIESVRPCNESLIDYTMNEQEAHSIKEAEHPELAFTRLWTMKEAILKMSGVGISHDLKNTLNGTERFKIEEHYELGYVYSIIGSNEKFLSMPVVKL